MPTLAPLPSTGPEADVELEALAEELEDELLELVLLLLELEPQAARDIAAATPSTASDTVVLRMCDSPFSGGAAPSDARGPMIVVRANISL